MSFQNELRKAVELTFIRHPRLTTAHDRIAELLRNRDLGLEPEIDFILGPSRSGKTEMLREFERAYPARREDGRLFKPVLYVPINTGTAPKDLPISVIQALGSPVPRERRRANELVKMMIDQLKRAQTHTIFFDEASHLVDEGSRIPPRQASDWFKDLHQHAHVSIVLSGVYRLGRLLETNEQLRNRTRKPFDFAPYRWDEALDRQNFAGCVMAFLNVFTKHRCTLGIDSMSNDAVVRHAYVASAGHIGLLANFFKELARHFSAPAAITLQALQATTDKLHLPGNGSFLPFSQPTFRDDQLLQVLCAELAKYDVPLARTSPEIELAQIRNDAIAVNQ